MPFKITKAQSAERDKLVAQLRSEREAVDALLNEVNDHLAEKRLELDLLLGQHNTILDAARELASAVADSAEEDINGKSERWQESEKGEAASEWQSSWADLDLADLEVDFPEDLADLDSDPATTLEEAPSEANQP